jgi:hypothetical protein
MDARGLGSRFHRLWREDRRQDEGKATDGGARMPIQRTGNEAR